MKAFRCQAEASTVPDSTHVSVQSKFRCSSCDVLYIYIMVTLEIVQNQFFHETFVIVTLPTETQKYMDKNTELDNIDNI